MKPPLHILHLEGTPGDAAQVESTLAGSGVPCTLTRVIDAPAVVAALETGGVDLMLMDQAPPIPGWDVTGALASLRGRWPDLPLILLATQEGEDAAIAALDQGATDYVLKSRLARLPSVIRRAMRDVAQQAERHRLEAQFIESQKMQVIGQLATGVAHDFNNILGVIMGYSDILLMKLAAADALRHPVMEIRRASERAAGLTRQLLVFGRQQIVQPVVLDLNAVVLDLEQMLLRLVDEHIEMTLTPGLQPGRILADPGYVGQVLMNLVVNARDAMPNGGRLTIGTSKVTLDESYARVHPGTVPGDYVVLSVSDTGTGMTDEVKSQLFKPFFTTKPPGKGTGLGLATCQNIVQQCGGHIGVCSAVGKGALFQVYFPCVDQPLPVQGQAAQAGPLPRGTETLLVVEDDSSVRHLATEVLQAQGYNVLPAVNGQDGLNRVRTHSGPPISLVVTDVIMPHMNGKVMSEWLKMSHPELKVLFTSGYTDDAIAHHGVLDEGSEFLAKPYTPATLTRKVRELLDA